MEWKDTNRDQKVLHQKSAFNIKATAYVINEWKYVSKRGLETSALDKQFPLHTQILIKY